MTRSCTAHVFKKQKAIAVIFENAVPAYDTVQQLMNWRVGVLKAFDISGQLQQWCLAA